MTQPRSSSTTTPPAPRPRSTRSAWRARSPRLDTAKGKLDPADFDRTVATLLSSAAMPVITKKPEGAWSHTVVDAKM